MIRRVLSSFLLAFQNIRSNFFHTLLSVLGIVIGVAALVAILSLIDGMERFAKEQLAKTTSLNAITVQHEIYKRVNEVRVRKDTFALLTWEDARDLKLSRPAKKTYLTSFTSEVALDTQRAAAQVFALALINETEIEALSGTLPQPEQLTGKAPLAWLTKKMAIVFQPDSNYVQLLGKKLVLGNDTLTVAGVLQHARQNAPAILMPIIQLSDTELRQSTPQLVVEATVVEDVPVLKKEITEQLKRKYPTFNSDFSVFTNEARVTQATRAFLLFRIIMGMIVGISVLVGGIGVMNVLLISVTERTSEIGIRKAMGANKRDILLQFLSESVTVSAFGSFVGLVVGILGTMAAVPIIKAITEIPFQADYTANTLLIITSVSLAVGIVFGTYPAVRAAQLDPVEAIRRE